MSFPRQLLQNGTLIVGNYMANQTQQPPTGMTMGGLLFLVIFLAILCLSVLYFLYDRHISKKRVVAPKQALPRPSPPTVTVIPPLQSPHPTTRTSLTTQDTEQEHSTRLSDNFNISVPRVSGPALLKTIHRHHLPEREYSSSSLKRMTSTTTPDSPNSQGSLVSSLDSQGSGSVSSAADLQGAV